MFQESSFTMPPNLAPLKPDRQPITSQTLNTKRQIPGQRMAGIPPHYKSTNSDNYSASITLRLIKSLVMLL